MITRMSILRVLLGLYAAGSVAVVGLLLVDAPGAGELAGTTSGKVLAAAILALGFGAAMAARDPWRNRTMIKVLIVFTALAALAVVTRLVLHDEPYDLDPAWLVLPFAAALPVLFIVLFPRAGDE